MHTISRIVTPLLLIAATGLMTSGCSADKFAVGDCVTTTTGITNDDMKKSSCKKTTMEEKLDGKTVYRITKVVAYQSRCPQSAAITFNYEPHDATYCLTEY